MSTVKTAGRLRILLGLILLCQAVGLVLAALLGIIGISGACIGLGVASVSMLFLAMFCLAEVAMVSVCLWRALIALRRLIREPPCAAGHLMPALGQLDCITENTALTGCAWTLLVTVLAICGWEVAATPDGFARCMLPAPCLWLIALGSHIPAASIRQRLPYTGASPLPLPVARWLLALCAVLTAAAGCMTRPEGWLLPACTAFIAALMMVVLWAWRRRPLLLRIAGWCLILCAAGLMLHTAGSRMADGTRLSLYGLVPLLPALIMICIPAVAGMSLLLLPNLIFPAR